MVRFEATHDMVALVVAVAAVWWLLTRPPTPPERLAAQRPAPSRAPRGEDKAPEGRENITPLPTAGFHPGVATA